MSPVPGIKFSRGPEPWVKPFLPLSDDNLKIKMDDWKNFKQEGPRHLLIGFLTHFFRDTFPFKAACQVYVATDFILYIYECCSIIELENLNILQPLPALLCRS
jgi:hypothetical protein